MYELKGRILWDAPDLGLGVQLSVSVCQLRRLMVPEFPVPWAPKISPSTEVRNLIDVIKFAGRALNCFFAANKDHRWVFSVLSITSMSPYRVLDNIVTPVKALNEKLLPM